MKVWRPVKPLRASPSLRSYRKRRKSLQESFQPGPPSGQGETMAGIKRGMRRSKDVARAVRSPAQLNRRQAPIDLFDVVNADGPVRVAPCQKIAGRIEVGFAGLGEVDAQRH